MRRCLGEESLGECHRRRERSCVPIYTKRNQSIFELTDPFKDKTGRWEYSRTVLLICFFYRILRLAGRPLAAYHAASPNDSVQFLQADLTPTAQSGKYIPEEVTTSRRHKAFCLSICSKIPGPSMVLGNIAREKWGIHLRIVGKALIAHRDPEGSIYLFFSRMLGSIVNTSADTDPSTLEQ